MKRSCGLLYGWRRVERLKEVDSKLQSKRLCGRGLVGKDLWEKTYRGRVKEVEQKNHMSCFHGKGERD